MTSTVDWGQVSIPERLRKILSEGESHPIEQAISAYEGFGSFHSENVEDLIAQSQSEYRVPRNLPEFATRILSKREIEALQETLTGPQQKLSGGKRSRSEESTENTEPCPFGATIRDTHFNIAKDMIFINHGAFGSALAGAVYIKQRYEMMMENEVVEFVDRHLLPLVVYSVRSLATFLHASPSQVVLLQNATFGLNSAMRIIESSDVVAFLDTEYLSVYKMMWFRCKEVGASLHEIKILSYIHDESVMGDDEALSAEICRQLPQGCTTIVVDHVTSTTAFCLPVFTHLIPMLRARGVHKIIVDGAHAPLQLDLNFDALPENSQPTVFVGNLHKWLSLPKSSGFMWVHSEWMEKVHTVVLSHGAGEGLLSEFIWDGTRDYGSYLAIPAALQFWESFHYDTIRTYCTTLLAAAVEMLTKAFKSRTVARRAPFMSLVEIPEGLQDNVMTAKCIQDVLHDVYNIEVPIKRVEGRFYIRISAFVYNVPEEYAFLREAVLAIADKWSKSPMREKLLKEEAARQASSDGKDLPCDERIRRQGGCGVSGLDPSTKPKKTTKFGK
ncbi:hypothetical protein AGDE_04629 [Angomonas deanei]|uniref:Aminotransferase class-V n=1 Tax=Angomonas deanei TaxID=59799 RepID=A0A7G2CLC7_9TRYP|nr:hypothetical protein AGDE_04629 [Angomonas deanei]CAD2219052.1 hypothetical protein, conserved [Angomonas deanei]|eukprot:EPY39299.1 hypothetical protein AGDE_04629 [Angomonas deanei]